jgi:hypothetical protein
MEATELDEARQGAVRTLDEAQAAARWTVDRVRRGEAGEFVHEAGRA